jgi:glycogen synthase
MRSDGQPCRILMTADAAGGVWPYAITLAEALGPRAEILLAVMGPPPSPRQRLMAALPNLTLVEGDFRLEWMPDAERDLERAGSWLRDLGAAFRPDIVHVNGFAAALGRWTVPVLVVAHSCVLSWWRAVHGEAAPPAWDGYAKKVARALDEAAQIVAPTGAMLRALDEAHGRARGRVIANGAAVERYCAGSKQKFVLSAGRLWDEGKNLPAIDAAAGMQSWPVFVAGDCRGPDGNEVLPVNARALGRLEADALSRWMARAAIFSAPAKYEPFGLSILEAAASGCALVLGDIASLRELWEGAALFVSPDDHAGLARALDRLMEDDAQRHALAGTAQRQARRFTSEAMADGYSALYAELMGRAGLVGAA